MTKVQYVSCIICGKTIVLKKFEPKKFDIDPSEYIILQTRNVVGGREGQGFWNILEEGKTIVELWESEDEREREIAETFKGRIMSILEAYVKAGIISKEEIEAIIP